MALHWANRKGWLATADPDIVTEVLALFQFALAAAQAYFNPDGTSAESPYMPEEKR